MMPPCKLKFRRLYFIFCKFYVADRAFEIEPFLCLRTDNHNTNPAILSITPLSGPSVANVFASLMLERQTPDVRGDDSDFSPFVGKPQVEGVM